MTRMNPRLLKETEILELAQHGVSFICPVCQTPLEAAPVNWQPGQVLERLACPNRHNHFLAYGDEESNLDTYCDWIDNLTLNQYG